jgi:hypothetical protein
MFLFFGVFRVFGIWVFLGFFGVFVGVFGIFPLHLYLSWPLNFKDI